MDVKYKIIFFIFVIVAILYAVHFLSSWMSTIKRRESFMQDDDEESMSRYKQENYVVAEERHKITGESRDLKLRVKILEIVEEFKIKDKTIKGNLVDYLFSDPIIKTITGKSDKDIRSFIETTYENMNVSPEDKRGTTPVLPLVTNGHQPTRIQLLKTEDISKNAIKEDFNDRMDDLMSHVNDLKAKLSRLKDEVLPESINTSLVTVGESISKKFGSESLKGKQYPNELKFPQPESSVKSENQVVETYSGIEGFENRRQYAFL